MKALYRLMFPAVLVAGYALAPQHAAAQSMPFCGGKLVLDTVFSTTTSTGKTARIDYFAQVRNVTKDMLMYSLHFTVTGKPITDRSTGALRRLSSYQADRLKLGSLAVDNPSGSGGLTIPEVKKYVVVTCR